MRITQIMLSKGLGGAERYYVDLSIALAAAGHEIQAISHRAFAGREALDSHPGLLHETVNAWGRWDLLALRSVRTAIARYAPAVVHAHLARGAWTAGRACARLGIPLVAKTHNYVDLKYYRNVDVFIPTTSDQARYLRGHQVGPERIVRIPNFSSLTPAAGPREPRTGSLSIVSYGRLVAKKGFDDLLRAMRLVLDQGVHARLAIGGDGPERERLRALRAELGLERAVDFPGWIDDPGAFLADADLFVLPSRLEPFGIVVLEAMACGVPIVSTRSEGPSEILDSRSAYLAEIGDPASLARVLHEAAGDPDGRRARAAVALEAFRSEYHRDAVVPRIAALYARVSAGPVDPGAQAAARAAQ
jgi:glycosyltransferase involved in cell wall biosynthesis